MFEDVPTEDLFAAIGAVKHDFESDTGAPRVDAITGWDRAIRHAQAEQLKEKVTTRPDGTVEWRTPTGHTYHSRTPSLDPLAA